jgi:hypothetical protein
MIMSEHFFVARLRSAFTISENRLQVDNVGRDAWVHKDSIGVFAAV